MRIVLIGPRGAGKTTIARILARRLALPLFSTDAMVANSVGMPIETFVRYVGWKTFRMVESVAVESLTGVDPAVIDTGGGSVENPANREILRRNSLVVYLTGDPGALAQRIEGDSGRPALTDAGDQAEEMRQVLEKRDPIYRAMTDLAIDTTVCGAERIANEIAVKFREALAKPL